ncbi:acyltransferase-domain-containing protein [Yarrowia lipolytica]|nr:acyltransferase-domain-containing protein [Yarrowia lipolytica]
MSVNILQDGPLPGEPPKGLAEESHTSTDNLWSEFNNFRADPVFFFRDLGRHARSKEWRAYDDYIGQPLFYEGHVEEIADATLNNKAVTNRIEQLADLRVAKEAEDRNMSESDKKARKAELEKQLQTVARQNFEVMTCRFEHKSVVKTVYYLTKQIFGRTYHQGLHVNLQEIEMLKARQRVLQEKKESIFFMPCHKSHLDYIALQALCFRVGISMPIIVAGDNLNFTGVGPILRNLGAFFIRRSFNDDKLYGSVIQAYITTLLQKGYNMECFIEGTRSRTGKLLPPKFGIIKYVLDAILSGAVSDTWICPVSTQYDKVVETESYVRELLGKEKEKENLFAFLSAGSIVNLKLGRIDVRFAEPWSVKEFAFDMINKECVRVGVQASTVDAKNLPAPIHQRILRSVGYKVLNDINKVAIIMPTSLIGTVLLTLKGSGISRGDLIRRVDWLIKTIKLQGGRVGSFGAKTEDIVDNGLTVLGPQLVSVESKGLIEPIYSAKDTFQLSYYRNQVIHLFVSDAIVAVALHSLIKRYQNGKVLPRVNISDLIVQVQFLSKLFSGEFVYGIDGIQTNLEHTLASLQQMGVIECSPDLNVEQGVGHITITLEEIDRDRQTLEFFGFLLWPFADGYWLAALAMFALVPTEADYEERAKYLLTVPDSARITATKDPLTLWVQEKELINQAQVLGKSLYHQGQINYYESVNKEMLKDALTQFVAEGILLARRSSSGRSPLLVAINPDWLPSRAVRKLDAFNRLNTGLDTSTNVVQIGEITPAGKLYDFLEAISYGRRKVSQRNITDMRVIRMADDLAQKFTTRQLMSIDEASRPLDDALVKVSGGKGKKRGGKKNSKI